MAGIAETIRQGMFFDEFEKQRGEKDRRERADASLALDESRHQSSVEREKRRDEATATERKRLFERQTESDRLRGIDSAEERAFRASRLAQGDRAAGFAADERADQSEYRAGESAARRAAFDAENSDRDESRRNRYVLGRAKIMQDDIDQARADPDLQEKLRARLDRFMADPEGYDEQSKETAGAPPEEKPGFIDTMNSWIDKMNPQHKLAGAIQSRLDEKELPETEIPPVSSNVPGAGILQRRR